jgi:hypothetical protein
MAKLQVIFSETNNSDVVIIESSVCITPTEYCLLKAPSLLFAMSLCHRESLKIPHEAISTIVASHFIIQTCQSESDPNSRV